MTGASLQSQRLKRLLDIVAASLGILLTAPAWLIIPVLIKLEDGGSILYGQLRVGRGMESFKSWKFRSMVEGHGLGPSQGHPPEEAVTRVGQLIRPTALDELPQLWNILKGDMSLVGPRADVPEETSSRNGQAVKLTELPGYEERMSVRPGLTGLAQLRLPRDAPHRAKLRLDLFYVRHRTLLLDVSLIFKSVFVSLTGSWPEVGRGGAEETSQSSEFLDAG